MTEEKKTRKSVPRPGSGRRGKDGAVGLKPMQIRLTPEQHAKAKENGAAWVREAITNYPSKKNPA